MALTSWPRGARPGGGGGGGRLSASRCPSSTRWSGASTSPSSGAPADARRRAESAADARRRAAAGKAAAGKEGRGGLVKSELSESAHFRGGSDDPSGSAWCAARDPRAAGSSKGRDTAHIRGGCGLSTGEFINHKYPTNHQSVGRSMH